LEFGLNRTEKFVGMNTKNSLRIEASRRSPVGTALSAAALLGTLLAAAACLDGITEPDVVGEWGAPHLALVLTEVGGTLEYDCAHGTINSGWTIDSEGRLRGDGEHVQEHGGPIREGEDVVPRPARYDGVLWGDHLHLSVTLTDSAQVLGPFDLERGKTGPVYKCL
jgi:hypothetical protein